MKELTEVGAIDSQEETKGEKVDQQEKYEGTHILEIFEDAVKYNGYILSRALNVLEKEKKTIDFGAGLGTFSQLLRGCDINVSCVEKDKELAANLEKKGFEVYTDVLDLTPDSIDQVFTCNVLEHIEEDVEVLKSLNKALKPNGLIYIYVPAHNFLYTNFDKTVGHVRRYTRRELKQKLENTGYEIISANYCDSIGVFATLAYKLIDRTGEVNPKSIWFYDRIIFPFSIILDYLLLGSLGKNVEVVARKK